MLCSICIFKTIFRSESAFTMYPQSYLPGPKRPTFTTNPKSPMRALRVFIYLVVPHEQRSRKGKRDRKLINQTRDNEASSLGIPCFLFMNLTNLPQLVEFLITCLVHRASRELERHPRAFWGIELLFNTIQYRILKPGVGQLNVFRRKQYQNKQSRWGFLNPVNCGEGPES